MVPDLKDLPLYVNKPNEIIIKKDLSSGQAKRWFLKYRKITSFI